MSPATTFSRFWNLSPAAIDELRREFDSAIGSVSRGVRQSAGSQIPLALWESEDHLILEFDVPGISQDNLDIQVEAGILTVVAKRPAPQWDGQLKHNEHRHGEFQRRIRLDESLDPKSVAAELDNGMLTLTIQRRVEAQPVKVSVRARNRSATAELGEPQPASPADDSHTEE